MPFLALQCEEMPAEQPFCLFAPGDLCFLNIAKIPQIFQFYFIFPPRKTVNFGLFVLFLIESGKT